MKKTFQWLSALALMVVSALAFVACGDDGDGDNGGNGGGTPDNSKIVGTWVIQQVTPNDGPDVGEEMTFGSDGTFIAGRDRGTYTYNSSTGAFTAKMNSMTMSGTFKVNGDVAQGSVNVVVNGRTKAYTMKMTKKDAEEEEEPAVASTKMVGTWKITMDGSPESSMAGKTAVFKADGTCTVDGKAYTYNCQGGTADRNENVIYGYMIYKDGVKCISGEFVVVNDGNVLNGKYYTDDSNSKYALVMKKPGYTYPTQGVQGRWQFTFVAQPFGNGNDEYFAERLPMYEKSEVFVLDENGKLYVEGDLNADVTPYVGTYTWNGSRLTMKFGGKYGEVTKEVGGAITFSGDNVMTIPQGKGSIAFPTGETYGFKATIVRVESGEQGGEQGGDEGGDASEDVQDTRIVGDWQIAMYGAGSYIVGSMITFTEEGTWTLEDGSGTYTAETDGKGRIVFNLYRNGSQIWTGKVVPVSGGNVLTGEVREVNGSGVGDYQQFLLKKPGYEYPYDGALKGRWEMTACNINGAPIGSVLVFEDNGELYIEGDPHVGSYTTTITSRNGKLNADVEMHLGNGPTVSGTIVIENNKTYASMTNGTATMEGETMQGVSVSLSKPGTR